MAARILHNDVEIKDSLGERDKTTSVQTKHKVRIMGPKVSKISYIRNEINFTCVNPKRRPDTVHSSTWSARRV